MRRHLRLVAPDERATRSCHDCVHVTYPDGVTRCPVFNEAILHEQLAATDCQSYTTKESP